jgi:translation initiation factor 4E
MPGSHFSRVEPTTPASPNTVDWQKREIQLESEWTFYFELGQPKGMTKEAYEDNMKTLGSFHTVQDFWRYWNNMADVTKLPENSNLRLFKYGIRPTWEDVANQRGGKYTIICPKEDTMPIWMNLVLSVIGSQFSYMDDVCGVVLSVRAKDNLINLWNKDSHDQEKIDTTFQQIKQSCNLDDSINLYYKPHAVRLYEHQKERHLVIQHTKRGSQGKHRRTRSDPIAPTFPGTNERRSNGSGSGKDSKAGWPSAGGRNSGASGAAQRGYADLDEMNGTRDRPSRARTGANGTTMRRSNSSQGVRTRDEDTVTDQSGMCTGDSTGEDGHSDSEGSDSEGSPQRGSSSQQQRAGGHRRNTSEPPQLEGMSLVEDPSRSGRLHPERLFTDEDGESPTGATRRARRGKAKGEEEKPAEKTKKRSKEKKAAPDEALKPGPLDLITKLAHSWHLDRSRLTMIFASMVIGTLLLVTGHFDGFKLIANNGQR